MRSLVSRRPGVASIVLLGVLAGSAHAQVVERPADERPSVEPLEQPAPARKALVLPAPPPPEPGASPLEAGLTIEVREVRVEGSTVFGEQALAEVTAPWAGRRLASGDLQDLLDAVTRLYVDHGYVSSGATLPDQDVDDGVLVVQVTEARLAAVVVQGNRFYGDRYLERRLKAAVPAPVNVAQVEDQLQLLLQEPAIARLGGELRPGSEPGQDVLVLTLEEQRRLHGTGRVANDNPPGIGSVKGEFILDAHTLAGRADWLEARFGIAEGLESYDVRYAIPVCPRQTTLGIRFRQTLSRIVEPAFEAAKIEASTWTAGIEIRHPVVRTSRTQLWLGLLGERRRTTTYLAGERFGFVEGPVDGQADVSVLRFTGEWTRRSRTDVVAARSLLSLGIQTLGATRNPGPAPDGRFLSWLAQAQWAHLFDDWRWRPQLLMRGDLQVSSQSLLSMERIAVGGVRTVRGYPENLLVRDNAFIGSAELRLTLLERRSGSLRLELVPFIDFAHAWNEHETPDLRTLASAGAGLRLSWTPWAQAYFFWGESLVEPLDTGQDLQERGIHLGLELRL